jgi:hypothetical protein
MRFTKRNQKKITKRNEILLLTKQNETKFRCVEAWGNTAEKEAGTCYQPPLFPPSTGTSSAAQPITTPEAPHQYV